MHVKVKQVNSAAALVYASAAPLLLLIGRCRAFCTFSYNTITTSCGAVGAPFETPTSNNNRERYLRAELSSYDDLQQAEQQGRYHIGLQISYDGAAFSGWRDLGTQQKPLSVQALLKRSLDRIHGLKEDIQTDGASRTDAGVHATGQVVSYRCASLPYQGDMQQLFLALNKMLPNSLRVQQAVLIPPDTDWHPSVSSVVKRYRYFVATANLLDPMIRRQYWHRPQGYGGYKGSGTYREQSAMAEAPHHNADGLQEGRSNGDPRGGGGGGGDSDLVLTGSVDGASGMLPDAWWRSSTSSMTEAPLQLDAMRQAAALMVGQPRDFRAFRGSFNSSTRGERPQMSTICHLHCIECNLIGDNRYAIAITGDRFLYKMARTIVGLLVQVGEGTLDPSCVSDILRNGVWGRPNTTTTATSRSGDVNGSSHVLKLCAPAHGLILEKVMYPPDKDVFSPNFRLTDIGSGRTDDDDWDDEGV